MNRGSFQVVARLVAAHAFGPSGPRPVHGIFHHPGGGRRGLGGERLRRTGRQVRRFRRRLSRTVSACRGAGRPADASRRPGSGFDRACRHRARRRRAHRWRSRCGGRRVGPATTRPASKKCWPRARRRRAGARPTAAWPMPVARRGGPLHGNRAPRPIPRALPAAPVTARRRGRRAKIVPIRVHPIRRK